MIHTPLPTNALSFFVNQKWVKQDYLVDFPDPAVDAVKRPAVGDVIH